MRRHLGVTATLLLSLLGSGCRLFAAKDTRPPMPRPMPPDAPYQYRYAHYVDARALYMNRDYQGFSLQHSSYSSPYLMLGNGRKVFDADELAPLVSPESDLARTVAARKRAKAQNRRVYTIGLGSIAVGAAFFLLGGLTVKGDGPVPAAVPFTIGGVAFFGGMGYAVFAPRSKVPSISIDESMVKTYNGDLAEHLRLCIDGFYFETCEAPPGAPGAPGAVGR
ncbi:MAG TPA: hypothetical protein VM261_22020 [Kofleriaceae bacterium]|nr:hypothetical protein [Kofleriaceae bacterium]